MLRLSAAGSPLARGALDFGQQGADAGAAIGASPGCKSGGDWDEAH